MSLDLTPAYRVELAVENRAHYYDVFLNGDLFPTHRFSGVTGSLSIISKPQLVPWATREALASVQRALFNRLNSNDNQPQHLTETFIEEILKEAKKKPEKIKDDAAELGTQAHAVIDLIIHGREPESVPEPIQPAVQAFKEWWKKSGIELVLGDTKVASLIHKYGGSLDALGRRNGKFIVLDWKTSNGIWNEYALQVAAYTHALNETFGIACEDAIIVRFGKKLPIDFEAKTVGDVEGAFQAFLSAKNLKNWLGNFEFGEVS